MNSKYVVVDLTRSMGTGKIMYWKNNDRGYTFDVREAKVFNLEDAQDRITKPYCYDLAIAPYPL